MQTSALKRTQGSETPLTIEEVQLPIRSSRQPLSVCPTPLHHPSSRYREPGRGTLICRLASSFEFNFETRISFDFALRYKIPHGMSIRQSTPEVLPQKAPDLLNEIIQISSSLLNQNPEKHLLSSGTLGGGLNFIEIAQSGDRYYLIIHTDARTLGQEIKKAISLRQEEHMQLSPVTQKTAEQALLTARKFGQWNRRIIAHELAGDLCEKMTDTLQEDGEAPPIQNLTSLYRFQVP